MILGGSRGVCENTLSPHQLAKDNTNPLQPQFQPMKKNFSRAHSFACALCLYSLLVISVLERAICPFEWGFCPLERSNCPFDVSATFKGELFSSFFNEVSLCIRSSNQNNKITFYIRSLHTFLIKNNIIYIVNIIIYYV